MESLTGNYMAHPENPIRIDPNGAQPAGPIYCRDGKLYRMGQNNWESLKTSLCSFLEFPTLFFG
jgi:hypothetical protein